MGLKESLYKHKGVREQVRDSFYMENKQPQIRDLTFLVSFLSHCLSLKLCLLTGANSCVLISFFLLVFYSFFSVTFDILLALRAPESKAGIANLPEPQMNHLPIKGERQ